MVDKLSPAHRSENMRRVKGRDTKAEILVRSSVRRLGYRFRTNYSALPGKPDLALVRRKLAIFVHGCFWHQHRGCKRATLPQTNSEFWTKKLAGNVARDRYQRRCLKKDGWKVLVIWECETKNAEKLSAKLERFLKPSAA